MDKDGVSVKGQSRIMAAIEDYFRNIYAPAGATIHPKCLNVILLAATYNMNDSLLAPIYGIEVEKATFNLRALKALVPARLNGESFQKNRDTIKLDVIGGVNEFLSTGTIGDFVNDTVVALTLNIPHSESISQLRLISCCNFIYKIISKIIVSRLKPLLGGLISP